MLVLPSLQTELEEDEYSQTPAFSLADRVHHTLHLHYPLVVHNLLPYSITLGEEGYSMALIGSGAQANINYTKLSTQQKFLIEVSEYRTSIVHYRIWRKNNKAHTCNSTQQSKQLSFTCIFVHVRMRAL